MHKRSKRNQRLMKKFKEFLKSNFIWCILGTAIYWAVPYIIVIILGIFNPWFFTIFAGVFAVQVALPAIPIIIGISLGIKSVFAIFKKNKKNIVKSVDKEKSI